MQKGKRLRFNLEVRSCSKKLKFFKNKYSPEKKLDLTFDFNLDFENIQQKGKNPKWSLLFTATFRTRLKSKFTGENSISWVQRWLSPVHWLSCTAGLVHWLRLSQRAWSNQCVTVLSVSKQSKFVIPFKYLIFYKKRLFLLCCPPNFFLSLIFVKLLP